MYHQFRRYRILRVFFDQPNRKFQLRELERITNISLPTIKHHVAVLVKEGFLKRMNEGIYPGYTSSMNELYRLLKRNDLVLRLYESGFINELEERCTPNSIVLYGSGAEGRDDERGDIDIFVQSKKQDINIHDYEKKIKRVINILFEPDITTLDDSLKNSLANGIVLSGYLKVI